MMERLIHDILPEIIHIIEIFGIIIITIGCLKTFVHYILSLVNKKHYPIRLELGNSLALGLEFKMGAEILKTVLIRDMSEIWILGAIIILRAVLSLLIHFEIKAEAHHQVEVIEPTSETQESKH